MSLYAPKRFYSFKSTPITAFHSTDKYWLGTVLGGGEDKPEPFFLQTRGRTENNVVHAKVVSPLEEEDYVPIYIKGSYPIPEYTIFDSGGIGTSILELFTRFSFGDGRFVGWGRARCGNANYQYWALTGWVVRIYPLQEEIYRNRRYRATYYEASGGCTFNRDTQVYEPSSSSSGNPTFLIANSAIAELANATRLPYDGSYSTKQQILLLQENRQVLMELLHGIAAQFESWKPDVTGYTQTGTVFTPEGVVEPGPLRDSFLFKEPDVLFNGLDPLLLGKDLNLSGYWRQWLIQHAFLDACEQIPRLNDNSISNVLELVSFIYNLVVKRKIEIPKSLTSAWLAYRYQLKTSTLDAEEAIEFVHRRMDLGTLDRGIESHGKVTLSYQGLLVTCRCSLMTTPREIGYLGKIWRALYTYGLQPNFYVLWDTIPYSFIVDWFVPIGDALSVLDAASMYSSEYYDFKKIVYSISYTRSYGGHDVKCYTRWVGSSPPALHSYYWLDKSGPASSKTIGYRILDAAGLILGGRKGLPKWL